MSSTPARNTTQSSKSLIMTRKRSQNGRQRQKYKSRTNLEDTTTHTIKPDGPASPTFLTLPLELRFLIFQFTTHNRQITVVDSATTHLIHAKNTSPLTSLRLTHSTLNAEITAWLRAARAIGLRSLNFAGWFVPTSATFVIEVSSRWLEFDSSDDGFEVETPVGRAQRATLENAVWRECARDVIVDLDGKADFSGVVERLMDLDICGRYIDNSKDGGGKEGLRSVRIRCERWLGDEEKFRLMRELAGWWGLCMGACRCGILVGQGQDGDDEGLRRERRKRDERWPRLDWSLWGERFTVARTGWRVLPRLSLTAWRWYLYSPEYRRFLSSPTWDGMDREKYLIKRFKQRGWLDSEDYKEFVRKLKSEERVRMNPGSVWRYWYEAMRYAHGYGSSDEDEQREEDAEEELAENALEDLKKVQEVERRARRKQRKVGKAATKCQLMNGSRMGGGRAGIR
ncbi:hypothetical protein DL98DRAFT_602415 [Cadophora sp. DSE1049]|nr:hypothetical protein DL98DRAFT_602415 [Cadophora sp. DSE1049]